jgi:hypothetical protein
VWKSALLVVLHEGCGGGTGQGARAGWMNATGEYLARAKKSNKRKRRKIRNMIHTFGVAMSLKTTKSTIFCETEYEKNDFLQLFQDN